MPHEITPVQLRLTALRDFPIVQKGDDLFEQILKCLKREKISLVQNDILIIAHKIVSKAEGRLKNLKDVHPSTKAVELAKKVQKDPRLVELILSESKSIIRQKPGVLIVEHKQGWIMANAGIDASNVSSEKGQENVLLLPANPEKTAANLRSKFLLNSGPDIAIVISDSFGRPWRIGTTGVAIGSAGLPSVWDRRGEPDLFDNELKVTQQAIGDEVATAAALLQGQAAEGLPVVHLRGLDFSHHASAFDRPAKDLIRNPEEDMFR